MVEAQVVHQDVSDHIDLGKFGSGLVGDVVVADTCREEDVAEAVDDQSVDLLGHVDVEAAGACCDVCQGDTLLLGDDGCRHGAGQIVDDDDRLRGMELEITLEFGHDLSREFVQILAVYAQKRAGFGYLQVGKEGRLKREVALWSGVNERVWDVMSFAVVVLDGPDERRHFHEVGACAAENANFLHLFSNAM